MSDIGDLKYGDAIDPIRSKPDLKALCLERLHQKIERHKDELANLMQLLVDALTILSAE